MSVSIIIPVLDDAAGLAALLSALQCAGNKFEVIVVDGGSSDGSREVAASYRCRLVGAECGRAAQMNAGAALARGDWLWFLHADSALLHPLGHYLAALTASPAWGFFPVRLSGDRTGFGLIAAAMNCRSRLTRIATGDQGIFVRRQIFDAAGGFPSIPLMEDIALSRCLRRAYRPRVPRLRLLTSSRRWERDGLWRTVWLMWRLRFAYWRGVAPQQLWQEYYGRR